MGQVWAGCSEARRLACQCTRNVCGSTQGSGQGPCRTSGRTWQRSAATRAPRWASRNQPQNPRPLNHDSSTHYECRFAADAEASVEAREELAGSEDDCRRAGQRHCPAPGARNSRRFDCCGLVLDCEGERRGRPSGGLARGVTDGAANGGCCGRRQAREPPRLGSPARSSRRQGPRGHIPTLRVGITWPWETRG